MFVLLQMCNGDSTAHDFNSNVSRNLIFLLIHSELSEKMNFLSEIFIILFADRYFTS